MQHKKMNFFGYSTMEQYKNIGLTYHHIDQRKVDEYSCYSRYSSTMFDSRDLARKHNIVKCDNGNVSLETAGHDVIVDGISFKELMKEYLIMRKSIFGKNKK